MRVLHLLNHIDLIGNGIVNVAVDLACLQAGGGMTVAVASAGGSFDGLLARHAVKLMALDQRTSRPAALLSLPWKWRNIIRDFRPDIVHAHMVAGAVIAGTLRRSSEYRLVTTVHNEFESKAKLMGVGDRVIAVSHAGAESLAKRGISKSKLRVVVNGTLGSPRVRPIHSDEPHFKHPAVLTVAGMYERKGIADLLSAFDLVTAKLPAVHLYLAGDGPDRGKFETQARKLSAADRIHFLGFQPRPQPLMRAADVFVLPSRREPFGLVFTEAMEMGCPVIGSDVDGIPEILGRNGEHGLLVPPSNPAKLAQAIERILCDDTERQRLREASTKRAMEFRVDRVVSETNAVYRELLDSSFSTAEDHSPAVQNNIGLIERGLA